METQSLPALRHVEVTPVEHEGEKLLCLSDPLGIAEGQMLLSPPALFVAASLDGVAGLEKIQAAFLDYFGAPAPTEQVHEVVETLDEAGFLFTPRFETMETAAIQAFRDTPVRAATLAGTSYPEDPDELRAFLDDFFSRACETYRPAKGDAEQPDLRCLIVPHIDFVRGGAVYAEGYQAFQTANKPDTVIIFGVAHCGVATPFTVTRKPFATPFGTLETDQEGVDLLAEACGDVIFEDEFVHRGEHSIEFQAVMLAYLFGPSVKIIPVLCSSFADDDTPLAKPAELPEVSRFLAACQSIINASDRCVSVVAGADLAHVGQRFGDDFAIDEAIVEDVARRDREDLAHVVANAPEDFYASVMRDENARRVCGLAPIYAALRAVEGPPVTGILHAYDYAHDPAGGIVSFASISLA